MSIYKSQFTGAEIEEALNKARLIEQDSNGFYKVDSNEDEPADLDDLIGLGNYTIYYFMNGHEDWGFVRPINIAVCLIDNILTQVVILVDKIYSRKMNNGEWLPWTFASLSTSFFISDTEPVEKELNNVWIDTSNPDMFSMYISNGTIFIPVKPAGMMSKDIYDTGGKNTDVFKYADDKALEIIAASGETNLYELLTTHENNAAVHTSDAERAVWNAKESVEGATTKVDQALSDLKAYTDTVNSGFSKTLATLAAEITSIAGLLTSHKEDTNVHITPIKESYWNSKAEKNHIHNLDGRVKISAENVVGGIFDIAQIPEGAKERLVEVETDEARFQLTEEDVQNGDMVAVTHSSSTTGVYTTLPQNVPFYMFDYRDYTIYYSKAYPPTTIYNRTTGTVVTNTGYDRLEKPFVYNDTLFCLNSSRDALMQVNQFDDILNIDMYYNINITIAHFTRNGNILYLVPQYNERVYFINLDTHESDYYIDSQNPSVSIDNLDICAYDNTIYIARNANTILYFDNISNMKIISLPADVTIIRFISEDSRGIYVLTKTNGVYSVYKLNKNILTNDVTAELITSLGDIYVDGIASGNGLFVITDGTAQKCTYTRDFITLNELSLNSNYREVCFYNNGFYFSIEKNAYIYDFARELNESSSSLYIVIDATNLDNENGYREVAYGNNRSVRWANVLERPNTLAGYGITDAFTKNVITEINDTMHQTILTETDTKIAALKVPVLEENIENHILNNDIHTTAAEKVVWNSKSDGDHTHLNDGRVTVDAENIVGRIPLDRIPKGAIEEIVFVRDDAERFALTTDKAQNGDLVSVGGTYIPRTISSEKDILESIYFDNSLYLVKETEFIFSDNTIVQIPQSSAMRFKIVNANLFLLLDTLIYKVNVDTKALEVVCQDSTSTPDIDYWNSKYYVYYNKCLYFGTNTTVASMTQIENILFEQMIIVVDNAVFAMITENKLYRLKTDNTFIEGGSLTFAPKYAYLFDNKIVIYGLNKLAIYNSVSITEFDYGVNVPLTFKVTNCGSYMLIFNNTNEMFISKDGYIWKRHAFRAGNNVNSIYRKSSLYFIPSSTGSTQFEFNDTIFDASTLYYIIDEEQLNNDNGYSIYSIGEATSVKWSNIIGKPTTLAGYGITNVYTKEETDAAIQDAVAEASNNMEDIKNEVTDLFEPANEALSAHIIDETLHTTPEKIAKWDGKAEAIHKHNAGDNTVEIDGSQITDGVIDLARLPKEALERVVRVFNDAERFALTKDDVQNGDTVVVEDAGYELDTLRLGVSADDILMAYGNGYYVAIPTRGYYGAYSKDLMTWTQFNIINNPTMVYQWTHLVFLKSSFLLFRRNYNAYYKIDISKFNQINSWTVPNAPNDYFEDLFVGNNTLCAINSSSELYEFPNMDLTQQPTKYILHSNDNPLISGMLLESGYYVKSSTFYLYFSKDDKCIHICDGVDSEMTVYGPLDTGNMFTSNGHLCKFCEAGGMVFALTARGIWTSKDGGYTWVQTGFNSAHGPGYNEIDFCEIAHGNIGNSGSIYMTVGTTFSGSDSYIVTSTDGLTWNYKLVTARSLTSVCYGHQKFIISKKTASNPTTMYWCWDGENLFDYNLNQTAIPGVGLAPTKAIYYDNCYIYLCSFGIMLSGDGEMWSSAMHPNMNYPTSMVVTKEGIFLSASAIGMTTIAQIYRNPAINVTEISIGATLGTTTFKTIGYAKDNSTGLISLVAFASVDEYFIYISDGDIVTNSKNTFGATFDVTDDPVSVLTIFTGTGKQLAILTSTVLIFARFTINSVSNWLPNGIETSFTKPAVPSGGPFIKMEQAKIGETVASRSIFILNNMRTIYAASPIDSPSWYAINVPDTSTFALTDISYGINRYNKSERGIVITKDGNRSHYFMLTGNTITALSVQISVPCLHTYLLNGYFIVSTTRSTSFISSADLIDFSITDITCYDDFLGLEGGDYYPYIPSFVNNKYLICGLSSSKYYILDNIEKSKAQQMRFERLMIYGYVIRKCNDRYIRPVYDRTVVYTADGITWRDVNTGLSSSIQKDAVYAFGYYFIVGYSNRILYSKDGDEWTQYIMPITLFNYYFNSIVMFKNSLYMTCGDTYYKVDYVLKSNDGFTWSKITLPMSLSWSCLVVGNDILAITAKSATSGFVYTTNGDEWTYVTLQSIITQVGLTYGSVPNIPNGCFCNNTFFFPTSMGYYVYTTTDFITWSYIKLPVIDWWICTSNGVDEVIFSGRTYVIRVRMKNSRIYIVEDDTKLNSEDGYLDYSVAPANGPFYWENISNTPSTISGYGIIDAYTKLEVDSKISQSETSIGGTLTTLIATNESSLRTKLAENTTLLESLNTSIAVIESASNTVLDVQESLTTYHDNIESIYNAIKESEIILTNIDTIL